MPSHLDLFWIPLGAGTQVVRISGRVYETFAALMQLRPRRDLYHSALVATNGERRTIIEMAPIPDGHGQDRGVVAEGAVGMRMLRRLRVFGYEVRRWPDGVIPDLVHAVGGPVRITEDDDAVRSVLDALPEVPTPVWGRDELRAGEMWNSNSVISWVLSKAELLEAAKAPPHDGRAPGWDAGVTVAAR